MTGRDVATLALVKAGAMFNRTWALPIVALSPTSRCHSRCLSCDWWRSDGHDDLPLDTYRRLADELPSLGTRLVLLTGGEPLLRDDVWAIAGRLRERGLVVHLITSGLALRTHAEEVAEHCAEVVISLDGSTPEAYRRIRGVEGLAAVDAGVRVLRAAAPHVRVIARATLHRHNFHDLRGLVQAARRLGVDRVSFLTADLVSSAFGGPGESRRDELALDSRQVAAFRQEVDACLAEEPIAVAHGFIAGGSDALRRLPAYYAAHLAEGPFPPVRCHAPQVSVVVDGNGTVRPCFFHAAIGSVRADTLRHVVTHALPAFRRRWSVTDDDTCRTCVCTLTLGWTDPPWA